MYRKTLKKILPLLLIITALSLVISPVAAKDSSKVSRFGEYSGYSEPIYDEWVRSSQYVEARDGTKLAVDIFRPAVDGVAVDDALPVVWTAERYRRAFYRDGYLVTTLDSSPFLTTLLSHGYVVASMDVRGTGASFGVYRGGGNLQEAWDLYDMTEWLAAQPWCNGNVGMYGSSYRGVTQYWAAITGAPHLKCIVPQKAPFDGFDSGRPNGIFWDTYLKNWDWYTQLLDTVLTAAPVDEDEDGSMLAAAVQEHYGNLSTYEIAKEMVYRNGWNLVKEDAVIAASTSTFKDQIQTSGVAMYHMTGWQDYFIYTQPLWLANVDNPQKMLIGPWYHTTTDNGLLAIEHLRWYDYWLKGIDNGIMDEPPIHYYTMGASPAKEWQSAWQWPLPDAKNKTYFFGPGPTGTVSSINDGSLSTKAPTASTGHDVYPVDFSLVSGPKDRWTGGSWSDLFTDFTPLDEKSLTYTTAPLSTPMQIAGYPVIHLWVSSTAAEADFFVYLEKVDEDGRSTLITDGLLRATNRSLNEPPWDNLGLPWHRSNTGDIAPLPTEQPVELVFALAPASHVIEAGYSIRVTVTCADYADNFDTPVLSPAPTVNAFYNSEYSSYVDLPITMGKGRF